MIVKVSKPKNWDKSLIDDPDQLWLGIRRGESEALSKLFCEFYSSLFNYGYKIMPQHDIVKDSIQELFVTLWSQRSRIGQAYSVKSYLLYSLRRIMVRNMKRYKNRIKRNEDYAYIYSECFQNSEDLMIHSEIEQERKNQLSEALKLLSARQREAVLLKYYDGMSNAEIAYVMEINQQSVYNHVSEAIIKLQEVVKV